MMMRKSCVVIALLLVLVCSPARAQEPFDLSGARAIPNNDTRALFDSLVAGRPFGQQTLLDVAPTLAEYCIALTPPNAAGDRTKIGDPVSRRWTRVGFGEEQWVWVVQGDVYTPNCAAVVPVVTPLPSVPPPTAQPPPATSTDTDALLSLLGELDARITALQRQQTEDTARIMAAFPLTSAPLPIPPTVVNNSGPGWVKTITSLTAIVGAILAGIGASK